MLVRGDTVRFTLALPESDRGSAWLRTNLGRATTTRREIIQAVERDPGWCAARHCPGLIPAGPE